MNKLVYLFPGQGSQYIGMGKSLYEKNLEVRKIFNYADEVLDFNISDLIFNGNQEDLTKTINAQPAILTCSIAFLEYWNNQTPKAPDFVAGHSLGEFSALVAAKVISFSDALLAVRYRGQVMQESILDKESAMAAILGLPASLVEQSCKETSETSEDYYVAVANYNGSMQTVISGYDKGVTACSNSLKLKGAKKIVPLQVSAPFHCKLMINAQKLLANFLDNIKFSEPSIPIISNVTANAELKAINIKDCIIKQVTNPVKFTQMVHFMQQNEVTDYLEIGPKKVLSGIIKSSIEKANIKNIEDIIAKEDI